MFAGVAVPLVVSGGGGATLGWLATGVWFASFVLGTIAVHGLKMHHKQRAGAALLRGSELLLAAVVLVGAFLGTTIGAVPVQAAIAVIPPAAVTAAIAAKPMHPRRLKLVGWSLVSANAFTLTCLLLI